EPTRTLSYLGLMLIGFAIAPVFASLISLTPARVGRAHSDNAIGFQIAAACLGGALLTGVVGVVAGSVGLEVIGVSIVALTVALSVSFSSPVQAGDRDSAAIKAAKRSVGRHGAARRRRVQRAAPHVPRAVRRRRRNARFGRARRSRSGAF